MTTKLDAPNNRPQPRLPILRVAAWTTETAAPLEAPGAMALDVPVHHSVEDFRLLGFEAPTLVPRIGAPQPAE